MPKLIRCHRCSREVFDSTRGLCKSCYRWVREQTKAVQRKFYGEPDVVRQAPSLRVGRVRKGQVR